MKCDARIDVDGPCMCVLPAGHAGSHDDGNGLGWSDGSGASDPSGLTDEEYRAVERRFMSAPGARALREAIATAPIGRFEHDPSRDTCSFCGASTCMETCDQARLVRGSDDA